MGSTAGGTHAKEWSDGALIAQVLEETFAHSVPVYPRSTLNLTVCS